MTDDIGHILDTWPYDSEDDLTARIIEGEDGKKLQMRIDMGVIQMNLDGAPSGEHPDGFESWFEYYEKEQEIADADAIDDFFTLDDDAFDTIRREAVQYYYRYLCLMKLGDYPRVIRDTERNYRLFTFVKKYVASEINRWTLDQYRPYVIMMNSRAQAALALKASITADTDEAGENETGMEQALWHIDEGIRKIEAFYEEYGLTSEMDSSVELAVLRTMRHGFIEESGTDNQSSLEEQLRDAVEDERFEDAALLRDKIRMWDHSK